MTLQQITHGESVSTATDKINALIKSHALPYPTLKKLDSNPAFQVADQSANSLLWPYLEDGHKDGITNKIVLVYSTDHSGHIGSGTYLATADNPEGPWTHHGMVFRDDSTGGEQHETPSLKWDAKNSRWLMYYQLKNIPGKTSQQTLVATAPSILDANGNPETWTIIGISHEEYYTNNAGDGHSGYFKPLDWDGGDYGFGLYGGTVNSRRAFWISGDGGLTYWPHPQVMQNGQHLISHLDGFDPANWLIRHNSGAFLERNGQLWLIAPVGSAASGGAEIPMGKICAFRVASDGVTLGRGIDITPSLQAWEDENLGVDQMGSCINYNNKIYVSYRAGGGYGGFGLMEVL